MTASFLAFLGVAALVIVTPGPDTALTVRNTLLGGRRAGMLTAAGVATGQATWALAASAGVAAALQVFHPAYLALKLAGAAYLLYLGIRSLVMARRSREDDHGGRVGTSQRLQGGAAYRQGMVSNLTNPKMAVFFVSLLPQFVSPNGPFAVLLGLGVVFSVMTLAWLGTYAAVVARLGDVLGRTAIRRRVDALTGVVLIGLGVRVAVDTR
jgi:threonine/homoserine/homoserine lactone efflux protein